MRESSRRGVGPEVGPARPRRRALRATVAAALTLACASSGYDYTPDRLRREVARRVEGLDASAVVVPFEVAPPVVERARALVGDVEEDERADALVAALGDPNAFGLRYEWAASGTASETLERGAGNCLALASTLIGIARGLGMRASYLEVEIDEPSWRTEGDLAVQADHIAARIDSGSKRRFVDFSGRLQHALRVRALDDLQALAHYYNNRGYELLNRSGTGEDVWRQVVRDFELATRVDPSNARAWNNLGVARARLGDDNAARVAYQTALKRDERSQSAHLNLVSLYLRASELDRAAEHLEAARRLDPRNPQIERLSASLPRAPGEAPPE